MSNAEDILYKAHNEGIREDVFMEAKVLRAEDPNSLVTDEFCTAKFLMIAR